MFQTTTSRSLDMTLLKSDGSIRVNDTEHFWQEEGLDWRYNLCKPFSQNEEELLLLVYGNSDVHYSVSDSLQSYLDDRQKASEKITPYLPLISEICSADIPQHLKTKLLGDIDAELNRMYPYSKM